MRALCFLLALGFCTATAAAGDAAWSFKKFLESETGWEGFKPGTMVHTKMTRTVKMAQLPKPQVQVMEEKRTLVKETDTHFILKVESKVGADWHTREEREDKKSGQKVDVKDAGTGKLKIGDQEIACAIKEVTKTDGEGSKEILRVWVSEAHGVVRVRSKEEDQNYDMTVVRLGVEQKIGDATIRCREVEMKSLGKGPSAKMTALMSMEFPNVVVRQTVEQKQGGMDMAMVREVVASKILRK